VSADVEIARQQWAEGERRLEALRPEPDRYRALVDQVGLVGEALRRRVGGSYTLDELAGCYREAERWLRESVAEEVPGAEWGPDFPLVADAAFYRYARGARDYRP
jgi:hypothetical protein